MNGIRIRAPRLNIREFSSADALALPGTSAIFNPASSHEFVVNATIERTKTPRCEYFLAIEEVSSLRVIGGLELRIVSDFHNVAEIGYWIGPRFAGVGFATEAVATMCRFAFENLPVQRIQATSAPENVISHRVLEKSGFYREGLLRSHLRIGNTRRDSIIYSKVRSDV